MHFNKAVLVSLCSFFFASILLATPSWESLGGSVQGKPFSVLGSDGLLRVFARGTDNALWFVAQTSPGGSWTPFISLGGFIISDPAAVQYEDGTIAVFAVGGDCAVWTRSQITASVDNYSDWTSLGGCGTSDLAVAQTFAEKGRPYNQVYLYMRGADNTEQGNTQVLMGNWSGWGSGGGYLASAPAAVLLSNQYFNIVVRGGDNALWDYAATGWVTLGGAMNGPPAGVNINGSIIYRGIDNAAWINPYNGTSWSGPVSLGGYIISDPTTPYCDGRLPGCGTTLDLEVFAIGGDNALWVTTSPGSGSPFGPWQSLGGYIVGDPYAVRNWDKTVDVFVIGSDGALWHIRQSTAGSWQ